MDVADNGVDGSGPCPGAALCRRHHRHHAAAPRWLEPGQRSSSSGREFRSCSSVRATRWTIGLEGLQMGGDDYLTSLSRFQNCSPGCRH